MSANIINKAERQFKNLRSDLSTCEQLLLAAESGEVPAESVSQRMNEASAGLATVMLTIRNLEDTMLRETSVDKRAVLKEQLKGFKSEHESLKSKLERVKSQWKEVEKNRTRKALFAAPTPTPSTINVGNTLTEQALAEKEDATLGYAETRVNEYVSIGTSTLDSLRKQRAMLKSTQRKILDAGTRLGLSQSVMKIISRKTAQDRYIFYMGVIVVFIVIYLCWRCF